MARLEAWLEKPWRWLWALLALLFTSVLMFAPFGLLSRLQAVDGVMLVDDQINAPAFVLQAMEGLPGDSTGLYGLYLLVDVAYLLSTAVFFAALLVRIWQTAAPRCRRLVMWLPVIFAVADLCEDLALLLALWLPNLLLAWAIVVATVSKFCFFMSSLLAVVIGLIRMAWQRL